MDAQLLEHGRQKFPDAGLLASSEGRQWSGLHAELRRHSAGELPSFVSSVTEITYAVRGALNAHVHRNGGGIDQATPVREGTLWICPEGVLETGTRITEALPEILHICLRPAFFVDLASDELADVQPSRLRYEADPDDALMRQLAHAIHRELEEETSAGRLLIEGVGQALAARLLHSWASSPLAAQVRPLERAQSLDPRRLKRVLDFLHEHVEADIGISDLAAVACLSPFYFARAFKVATGLPPYKFLSQARMERAKTLLVEAELSIEQIAQTCHFSSQASFTRAFTRAAGVSPARFRMSKGVVN